MFNIEDICIYEKLDIEPNPIIRISYLENEYNKSKYEILEENRDIKLGVFLNEYDKSKLNDIKDISMLNDDIGSVSIKLKQLEATALFFKSKKDVYNYTINNYYKKDLVDINIKDFNLELHKFYYKCLHERFSINTNDIKMLINPKNIILIDNTFPIINESNIVYDTNINIDEIIIFTCSDHSGIKIKEIKDHFYIFDIRNCSINFKIKE